MINIDWNPSPTKIRRFGFGLLLGLSLSGLLMRRRHGLLGLMILGAGIFLGMLALISPKIGFWIYRAWTALSAAIVTAVSTVILTVFYYACLTPMALILRRLGRDALKLKRPRSESYWAPLEMPRDKTYYERLY